jgi:hypothetical protein
MLEALADAEHEEHDNYVRWIGGDTFDRSAFDIVAVNAALQRAPQRSIRISHF